MSFDQSWLPKDYASCEQDAIITRGNYSKRKASRLIAWLFVLFFRTRLGNSCILQMVQFWVVYRSGGTSEQTIMKNREAVTEVISDLRLRFTKSTEKGNYNLFYR